MNKRNISKAYDKLVWGGPRKISIFKPKWKYLVTQFVGILLKHEVQLLLCGL